MVIGECTQGTLIHPASFLRDFQLARGNVQASLFAYPYGSKMLRSEFYVRTEMRRSEQQAGGLRMHLSNTLELLEQE